MTVSANSRRREYEGNGVTTVFSGPMAFESSDIEVYLYTDGETEAVPPGSYDVERLGIASGTRITMRDAPPLGSVLLILRVVEFSQQVNITNQGAFHADTIEKGFDALAMQIQQVADSGERAIRYPDTTPVGSVDTTLPAPEPGRVLGWRPDGSGLVNLDPVDDPELRNDLLNPSEGASLVAYGPGTVREFLDTLTEENGAGIIGYMADSEAAIPRSIAAKLTEFLSPEDFGAAGTGISDDTMAVQAALDRAAALGMGIMLTNGRTYLFSRLTIPAGSVIRGFGILRSDGTTGPTHDHQITVAANVDIERLHISTPGTENNFYPVVFTSDNVTVVDLIVESDIERVGTEGVWIKGSNVRIGSFVSKNIMRPLGVYNYDSGALVPQVNIVIGSMDVQTYVRGLVLNNVERFRVGPINMRGRATAAARSPGHNGILIGSSKDGEFADIRVEDCGEHGVRIGGGVAPRAGTNTERIRFGTITVARSGGCAFKIAPTPPEVTRNITVDGVFGIDVADGLLGGNSEVVRITSFDSIRIGFIHATKSKYETAGPSPLRINSGNNLHVGSIFADQTNAALQMHSQSDMGTMNLTNVFIDSLYARIIGTDAIGVTYGEAGKHIGNIYIRNINIDGYINRLVAFESGVSLIGPFYLQGESPSSTSPAILNPPNTDFYQLDLKWGRGRVMGTFAAQATFNYSQAMIARGADLGSAPSWYGDYCLLNGVVSPGAGKYGGGYYWTRLGSTRRGAGVVMKQITADDKENGVAILTQDVSATSNESLREAAVFKHNGVLQLPLIQSFSDNASAVSAGLQAGDLYRTATGEVRCVV